MTWVLSVPPVQHQSGCTAWFEGGWGGGGWWWWELHWCGSADSRSRSSKWCPDRLSLPPQQGSSRLQNKGTTQSRSATTATLLMSLSTHRTVCVCAPTHMQTVFYSQSSQIMATQARTIRSRACSPSLPTAMRELVTEEGKSCAFTVIIWMRQQKHNCDDQGWPKC